MIKEKKKLTEKVGYLKDIPFLKDVTKTKLSKFTYFFEEKTFKRGQILYEEGDPCKHVYIVKEGEFELKKKMPVPKGKKIDITEFLSQFPHNKSKNKKDRILAASHPVK